MANAGKMRGSTPYRGIHIGWPGSGKTGGLVSLANVGYKIRMIDFDGNNQALVELVNDEALPNIDIVTVQDRLKNGDKYMEVVGIPDAFNAALRLMQEWKYKDEDGEEVNLGKSSEWGMDTIVVVDTLTTLAKAAKNRAMKMNNKTPSTMTSAVWGHAVADVTNFIELLKAERNGYHLIINSHKQILGPADFIAQGDDEVVKEKKMEMIRDGMIPPRVYPVAVTKPSSQTVHGLLPTMLEFEKTVKLGKDVRLINTVAGPEIDVKIPGKKLKASYPIETGMAEIFEAMGYKAPGFK